MVCACVFDCVTTPSGKANPKLKLKGEKKKSIKSVCVCGAECTDICVVDIDCYAYNRKCYSPLCTGFCFVFSQMQVIFVHSALYVFSPMQVTCQKKKKVIIMVM